MELDITGTQIIVVVNSTANHLQTLLVGKEGAPLLEGILRGDDEPHFVERGMRQHGTADNEMAHMYGIERAKEKTDVSHKTKLRIEN